VGVAFDFDDDRLPATRRGVRWMLAIVAVTGAVDALGPLVADAGLVDRTVADLVLTAVALSLPWLLAAALLPYRPRLATAMVFAMALVTLPRQVWQLWLLTSALVADGEGPFPEVVPRSVIVLLVLITLWVAYLSRPRGHWGGEATPLTRRALVPTAMALAWTVGPITDPVPSNGVEIGKLLPLYLGNPLVDLEPWGFLLVHALPVLIVATIAVGKHRRVAGAGMMVYGVAMFLLVLAEFLRARVLFDSTLLPLGGIAFLGLFSLIVIGHQWSTEGARFADPGKIPERPGQPAD
jgi:hypothetical protein